VDDAVSVALWAVLVVLTGIGMLLAASLLGPRRSRPVKADPYECGVPLFQDARERVSVHFYLMSILFLLFDVEIVFLLPWAILCRELSIHGLVSIGAFVAVLGTGYVYIWKRRLLDWE